MAVGDAYVFPGFLKPVLTLLVFPKPPTTFLTCFCRGERLKYAGKKSRLKRGSNSQPPGYESDTPTTEPPGLGHKNGRKLSKQVESTVGKGEIARYEQFLLFPQCFQKACFPGAPKCVIVWEWVKPFTVYIKSLTIAQTYFNS